MAEWSLYSKAHMGGEYGWISVKMSQLRQLSRSEWTQTTGNNKNLAKSPESKGT